jgi:16S rRNA processing protein RimM
LASSSNRRPDEDTARPPDDLVVMGRVSGPFGVKGWVKVQPFTQAPENLLAYSTWWVGAEGQWQEALVEPGQVQGGLVVVRIAGCEDRDAAALYRGKEVAVSRGAFPQPADNEFYWADLVGLRVVNERDEDLGDVKEVIETGANDVLVVQGERERLIPFTQAVVKQVHVAGRVIRVEWDSDY